MTAVAGGMRPVPVKITGKLMYLTMEFGYLRETAQAVNGAIAPTRKKKTRP